jgi:hypothetical protein
MHKVLAAAIAAADGAEYVDVFDYKDEIAAWCAVFSSELQQAYDNACCMAEFGGVAYPASLVHTIACTKQAFSGLFDAYSCPRAAIEARAALRAFIGGLGQ